MSPGARGARAGRVILVGAGPGDPDLITLRGAAALRSADAVVYDALAPPELVDLAPPAAQRIDVGKRGHDAPTRTQPETLELLLRLAGEGKTVVRLKGGDPFVFGRGGEEASACVAAGIPFEVVPGVSSAIAAPAYAGIPVTDRRHAASFAVVTGHRDPTRVSREIRWGELARAVDTLVILMGMRRLGELSGILIAEGCRADAPAAVIEWASTGRQRVVEAPLRELAARAADAGLAAPGAVVIGDVVRLRAELRWFDRSPLLGRRVVVTRAPEQAADLLSALRAAGAEPVMLPMLRLVPPKDPSALDAALERLEAYDAIVFASANAVRFTAERASAAGRPLAGRAARVVCVGPATATAARHAGLRVDLVPEARHDAAGLVDAIARALPPRGRRFLLPRAEVARETLPAGLRALGATVECVSAYRNAPPDVDPAEVRGHLVRGDWFALTFASPSAVRRFFALLDPASRAAAARCAIAAIGPVTAEALREEGLEADVVSEHADAAALVDALSRHVGGSP